MYSQFFGIESNPFSQSPPSNNDYLPTSHSSILNHLDQAIKNPNGLFLLLGSIGVGKTSLIKAFANKNNGIINDLTPSSTLLPSTTSHLEEILNCISNSNPAAAIFFLDNADQYDNSFLSTLFLRVADRINNKIPTLLILLGCPTLESNIRTIQIKHASSLLLYSISLLYLPPFENAEIKNYIHYRLKRAGYLEKELFTNDAIQRIASLSTGLPRLINTICGVSIFQASLEELSIINGEVVDKASEGCFLSNDIIQTKEPVELKEPLQELSSSPSINIIQEKNNSSITEPHLSSSKQTNRALASSSTEKPSLILGNEKNTTPTPSKQVETSPAPPENTHANLPKKSIFFASRFRSSLFVTTILLLLIFLLWDHKPQYFSPNSTSTPQNVITNDDSSHSIQKGLFSTKITSKLTTSIANKEKRPLPQKENQTLAINTGHIEFVKRDETLLINSPKKINTTIKPVVNVAKNNKLNKHPVSIPEVKKQKIIPKVSPVKKPLLLKTKTTPNQGLAGREQAIKEHTSARFKLNQKGISYDLNSYFSSVERGRNQLFKLFLDSNMPIDIQEKSTGNTTLIQATKKGYLDIVTTALNRKANINKQNKDGKTALIIAAAYGHYSISQKLLRHGANVHITDNMGRDALMIAVQKNQLVIVKDLLKYGANKKTKDSTGLTALLVAQHNNLNKIVSLLAQ